MSKKNALHEKLRSIEAGTLFDVPDNSPMRSTVSIFRAHVEKGNFSDAYRALIDIVDFDDISYAAFDQSRHTVRLRQRARKVLNEIRAMSHDDDIRRELEQIRSTRKISVKG